MEDKTHGLSGETLDENFRIPVYTLSASPQPKEVSIPTDEDVLDGVLVTSPRGRSVE